MHNTGKARQQDGLFEKVVELRKMGLGAGHNDTISSVNLKPRNKRSFLGERRPNWPVGPGGCGWTRGFSKSIKQGTLIY